MDVSVPGWMLVMVMVMVIVFDTREKEFVAGSLSGSSVRVAPSPERMFASPQSIGVK